MDNLHIYAVSTASEALADGNEVDASQTLAWTLGGGVRLVAVWWVGAACHSRYWSVKLLHRSCQQDSDNPGVWAVAAELEHRLGRPERVLDAVLKQCRATMVANWSETVSYTHLTLPTIYSV